MIQLNTSRLLLREVQQQDLQALHELHTIPEVAKFNTYDLHQDLQTTQQLLTNWLNGQQQDEQTAFVFTILLNDEFAGIIALSLASKKQLRQGSVWYLFLPKFWGKGLATESLTAILDFAFTDLLLHRVEAGAAVGNTASYRVLEKAGMVREGSKRKVLPLANGWSDNYEYAILDEEWLGNKS